MPWIWVILAQRNIQSHLYIYKATWIYDCDCLHCVSGRRARNVGCNNSVVVDYIWANMFGTDCAHIFECDIVHINHFSGLWFICSSSSTQAVETAACSERLSTVKVLVVSWCWQSLGTWTVCLGCGQVQHSDTLKPLLSTSWLWAFLPKMLLYTTAPCSHLCTSLSSIRRSRRNDVKVTNW
jgi:hypothetical protein